MKKTRNEKRRLLLNKRQAHKTGTNKRAHVNFARPSDSKLFVKASGNETVRAPLNKRLIALILAIVMVVGLIPAGIFMLRPKAAGNGLEPVEMSVRVNGADDFATAVIPGGEISRTVEDAEYSIALPDTFLYRKAVVIDSSDNSETEIFSAGRIGNKTYYSLNENSATGTLLNDETQRLVLVIAEKYNVTLNYNDADGDATTSAVEGSYIWGGDSLRVQGTPNTDREVSTITYTINEGETNSAPVSNNSTTIPASSITGNITVIVNFGAVDKYTISEVGNDNHGGLTTGTTSNDKSGANPVSPGGTASFYIYSESNTGGSNFVFNMLSINGVDVEYPVEKGSQYTRTTPFHNGGEVKVTLVETDTALRWNSGDYNIFGGQDKHRSLYLIEINNIHEDLDVAFHFKQRTDRQIMIKGLRGIQETGAAAETRSEDTKYIHLDQVIDNSGWLGVGVPVRNYRFVKNENNFYGAYYNQAIGGNFSGSIPSNNVYFYRVKPGYNPYSVAGNNVYAQYYDDNGVLTSTVTSANLLAGDSSADRPDVVIQKASVAITAGAQEAVRNDLGRLADWEFVNTFFVWLYERLGAFDSEIRYWGSSDILTNGNVARAKDNSDSIFASARNLALTSIQAEEQDPSVRWYAIALNQNASNNQQLYINADLYNYYLQLDLGTGGSLANSSDRFNANGTILTEKDAYKHTVDDREKYITFPAETPTNSNGSVIFGGWRAVDANGDPILRNNEEVIYQSLEQIKFDWQNLSYAYGKDTGADSDVNQVLAFEAVWRDLRTANITTISVETWAEVPEGTAGAVSKEVSSDEGTVTKYYRQISNQREIQPVGQETLILNYPEPENAEFYELNTTLSVLDNVPERQSTIEQIPEDNRFSLYYDFAFNDFSVTKQVLGNPTQLNQGFPITVTITKPNGAPLTPAEALDIIEFSNGDKTSATINGNSITYTKTFGRSDAVTFTNVPHGWAISVSEPKATNSNGGTPDYETTITSKPETAGSQAEEQDGYTGPTTWNGVLNNDTSVTVTNKSESYLILDKNIARNGKGNYDLTMEAFATGDVLSETKTEKIPTDFVVIVDQSGSMAEKDMAIDPVPMTGTVNLEDATSGQYYYRVEDETGEHFYRVYGKKGNLYQYYAANTWYVGDILDRVGADLSWFQGNQLQTFDYANQFFFRENNGSYRPINLTVSGRLGTYYNTFSYVDSNNSTVTFDRDSTQYGYILYKNLLGQFGWGPTIDPGETGYNTVDSFVRGVYNNKYAYTYSEVNIFFVSINTGMLVNYPMYDRHIGLTGLYYRDIYGEEHIVETVGGLETTEFCDASSNALTANTGGTRMLYDGLYVPSDTERRRDSLEKALNHFVQTVANETDDVNGLVDNKVAIVGFSSNGYNNTEVLTGNNVTIRTNDSNHTSVSGSSYFPYNGSNYTPIPANASNGTNYNGPQYSSETTNAVYQDALVSAAQSLAANEGEDNPVNPGLEKSIKSITAYGGTQPEDGFIMAYNILDQRETKTYQKQDGSTVDRNTVVIFFTDGEPGNYAYSDRYKEANDVIKEAANVKGLTNPGGTHPTVYSVGVFDQSDGNPLTYSKYYKTSNNSNVQPTKNRNENSTGMRTEDKNLEYDLTWVDTLKPSGGYSNYYYLNREWVSEDIANYGKTANDTIFDYMSVVSSNYPNATGFTSDEWISGTETRTWKDMTSAVRGAQIVDENQNPVNDYYRMASNQQTLLDTFAQIATTTLEEITSTSTGLDGTAVLRDVINGNDFVIPEDPSEVFTVTVYTQKGDQDTRPTGNEPATAHIDFHNNEWVEITEDMGLEGEDATDWYANNVKWTVEGGNAYVDVSGFDYGRNYIANGKLPNATEGTDVNEGKKLIVVVSGLEPKETATGELKSNTTDSGIYKVIGPQDDQTLQMMNAFPVPEMYRFAYNLRESGKKTDDSFDISFTRNGNGTDGIMVTYPNGNRDVDAIQNGTYTWEDAENNDAIYFETFDEGAYLAATVPSTGLDQETYDYSVSLIDMTGTTSESFDNAFDIPESNSTIHVTNASNIRTVVIKEFTRGVEGEADYSSKTKRFPIQVKLTKADGETLVSNPIAATIVRKDGSTDSVNLSFHQNNGVVEIELADGDYITFDTLKNYKVVVWEGENDHEGYYDSYTPDENGAEIGTGVIAVDDDNDNNVIEVINRLMMNPDVESGVVDSSDPSTILFAILGGIILLGIIGSGIFLWKKKDEFVEE